MARARTIQSAVVLTVLAALCPSASALNPSLDVSQYAHKSWTIREGFFKGVINSIAQTADGYLWLGTEFGLVRFDGVRSVEWTPRGPEHLPSSYIRSLFTARDGTVWIGTSAGLASWNGLKLTRYPELEARTVWSILEDHDGTIWVASSQTGSSGWLCEIRDGKTECHGQDGSLGRGVLSLYEDRAGDLWAGASSGLWRWKPGPPKRYAMPEEALRGLVQGDDGNLLIGTNAGLFQLVGGKAAPYRVRGASPQSAQLVRDRNGGLWIGSYGQGLIHQHSGRTDVFSRLDGLSADEVLSLFEDREGNIWAATQGGLDRFRELPVVAVSAKQGLSTDGVFSVLAAKDGSVWLTGSNGLDRWRDEKVTTYRKADGLPDNRTVSLNQGEDGRIWVSSSSSLAWFDGSRFVPVPDVAGDAQMSGEAGHLWVSDGRGLLHLRDGHRLEEFPWSQLGRHQRAVAVTADREGGVWLGYYLGGGVEYFKDGQVRRSYAQADGLGEGYVSDLQLDSEGKLWASTQGGLSVLENKRFATLNSKNGLPCDTVYWRMEADDHSNWLYMSCGLVRIERAELDAWMANPKRTIQSAVFDGSDGVRLRSILFTSYTPHVAKSPDGKLWFTAGDGVSVIDPLHLPVNKIPPPVHIEQITADRKTYDASSKLRLPALTRDLEIDYTALSLVAPEKNRFRIKLEGRDPDWKDVGNERRALYNDLPPRTYRFRVMASNNSGVWNETGDTLEFSIAPAYYQTNWFRASLVAAFFLTLWGLYELRLRQIAREFNAQLDGRVDERLRVARELHDTMLQSFQAALIQMQAARNIFSRRPEKTEESIDKAINTASGAIAEGRSAIQDLRLHPAGGGDLAHLLTTAGQELARSEEASGNPPAFGVTVEGARRDVAPLIQDEIYRIARELLRNAFHHAQAGRIEVEIRYDSRQFRLHVRDDGKGIDSEVLKAGGRAGHYGLPGMRERANRFGGKLDFWSEAGAGTEAVLTVPGAVAYGGPNGGRFAFLRRKLWIHER